MELRTWGRGMATQVGGGGTFVKFEILPEHAQQVLFESHHQWMHPGIEQDVGALESHLRCVARGEVLDMDRC